MQTDCTIGGQIEQQTDGRSGDRLQTDCTIGEQIEQQTERAQIEILRRRMAGVKTKKREMTDGGTDVKWG